MSRDKRLNWALSQLITDGDRANAVDMHDDCMEANDPDEVIEILSEWVRKIRVEGGLAALAENYPQTDGQPVGARKTGEGVIK